MEKMSIVLSVVEIIISLAVAFIEYRRDYSISRMALEAEFFKEIYKKHLICLIPDARKYIWFNQEGILSDVDNLIDELKKLKQDSLYFYYNDTKYYKKLKQLCQELEEFLEENAGKIFLAEEQGEVVNRIHKKIRKIYKHISEGYLGIH